MTHASRVLGSARFDRVTALLIVLAGVALVVAACGGGSAGGTPPDQASGSESQNPAQPNEAGWDGEPDAVAFANCMRAHGVANFPDPRPSGGFLISGEIANSSSFGPASEACAHLRPAGNTAGGQVEPAVLLAFSQCMRENGVPDFPDIGASGTGGAMAQGSGPSGINPSSPAFQAALDVCGSEFGIQIMTR